MYLLVNYEKALMTNNQLSGGEIWTMQADPATGTLRLGGELTGRVNTNVIDTLRSRLEDRVSDLEAKDKIGNFELQDLMATLRPDDARDDSCVTIPSAVTYRAPGISGALAELPMEEVGRAFVVVLPRLTAADCPIDAVAQERQQDRRTVERRRGECQRRIHALGVHR